MKNRKVSKYTVKTLVLIITTVIIIMFSYFTVWQKGDKKSVESIVNNLYVIGSQQENILNIIYKQVKYELDLYTNIDEVKSLDKEKIEKLMSFIRANKEVYTNILIINTKKQVLYGYTENKLQFLESDYVRKALAGEKNVSNTINIDGKYYIDVYSPIMSDKDTVLGIICIRISLSDINEIMKRVRLEDGIECYIVNKDGVMLTESKFIPDAVGNVKVDLKNVKLSIDYSKSISYRDYRGQDVYGRYFPIGFDNWTLIVEKDAAEFKTSQEDLKSNGRMFALIETIIIICIQYFFKRKFDIEVDSSDIGGAFRNFYEGNINMEQLQNKIEEVISNDKKSDKNG